MPTGPAPPQPTFSAPSVTLNSASSTVLSSHLLSHTRPWLIHACAGAHTAVETWSLCHMALPFRSSGVVSSVCLLATPAHTGSSVPKACLPPRRPPRLTDWLLPSAPRWHCSSQETSRGIFTSFFTLDFYLLIENGYYFKVCLKIHHILSMFPESRSAHLCLVAF